MDNKNIGKNSILYFLSMMLPKCISLLMVSAYSYFIEPGDYGIYAYTTNVTSFLAVISCMGLNIFYLKYYGVESDKKKLNGTIYWSLAVWNSGLIIAVTAIIFIIWPKLNMSFPFWPYLPLALFTHYLSTFEIIPTRTYRLKGEVNFYFLRILIKTSMNAVLCLFFLVHERGGIMSRYYADIITNFVFAAVFIRYMIRNSYIKIDKSLLIKALRFAVPLMPSEMLSSVIPLVNTFIIEKILGLKSLGMYTMALSLASLISMITTSITFTFEPEFYMRVKTEHFPQYAKKIKNMQIVGTGIVCTASGLFIKEAVEIFLSAKYQHVWYIVQMLAVSYYIDVLYNCIYQHAVIQDRSKQITLSSVVRIVGMVLSAVAFYSCYKESVLGAANIIAALIAFISLYFLIDQSIIKTFNFTRDYFMVMVSVAMILISRFSIGNHIIVSICFKGILLIAYVILSIKIYHVNINKLAIRYFKVKK